MREVFEWILDHWAFCVFCLTAVIQFTPAIKWNPITAMVKWLGRLIIQPAMDQLASLRKEVEDIKEEQKVMRAEQKADEKDRIRHEVLEFANSCRNHRKHTQLEFQHIIDLNDKYEKLLRETNDTNGVYSKDYEFIVKIYRQCQADNIFLG